MDKEESISLNKYLSSTGICSRREADKLIESGRVSINEQIGQKGNRVNIGDVVRLDGKLVQAVNTERFVYILLNKPVGIVCTTDKREKKNIIDFVNFPERIFPVGRLDRASEGLILLTSDGDIVNKILRAGNEHEKEYLVEVDQPVSDRFLKRMSKGVPILGTITKPCRVERMGKSQFRIILTEGLNRQIRRMCSFLGYEVTSLRRVRIMHLNLDGLPTGKWRHLSAVEKEELFDKVKQSRNHISD